MKEIENRLSVVKSHLEKSIMEIGDTTLRDLLIESRDRIEKVIWHLKKDKVWELKKRELKL